MRRRRRREKAEFIPLCHCPTYLAREIKENKAAFRYPQRNKRQNCWGNKSALLRRNPRGMTTRCRKKRGRLVGTRQRRGIFNSCSSWQIRRHAYENGGETQREEERDGGLVSGLRPRVRKLFSFDLLREFCYSSPIFSSSRKF